MTISIRSRLLALGSLALLALSACNTAADDEGTEDACTGRDCADRPTDTGRDTGGDDTGADDTGAADTGADTDDGQCGPGESTCVSPTVSGVCLADGTVREIPCGSGEICRDGNCITDDGTVCDPTTAPTCASAVAVRTCAPDGRAFVDTACPAEAPNCLAGACTDQVCEPGRRTCRGQEVLQCADDGTAQTSVEQCAEACLGGECVAADPCTFTDKEYLGCDFWAVYLDNEARGLGFAVTVSNPGGTAVGVTVTDGTGARLYTGTVPPRDLVLVDLGARTQLDGSSLSNSAFRVQADGPVTVHQFNPPNNLTAGYSNDASLLLPANALGTDYLVMAYHSGDDLAIFARLSARWYVTVVAAAEGETQVTVETPAGIRAGSGVPAMAPGSSRSFTLTQGQVLNLLAEQNNGDDPDPGDPADMTGMRVTSNKPVAVFSGSEASYIPDDVGAADHIEQQLYPVASWGREYVLSKFAARGSEDDVYRVMTSAPNTTLRTTPPIPDVDGRVLANAGDAVEFIYRGDFVVSADNPISVGQFMVGSFYPGFPTCTPSQGGGCAIPVSELCPLGATTFKRIGDPAFLLPSASSQFRRDYTFLVPEGYLQNYVGVVLPTGASVVLDGAVPTDAPAPIAGTPWQVLRLSVEPGTHSISSTQPFGLSVYGYGCDVSYAYPGGLDLGEP